MSCTTHQRLTLVARDSKKPDIDWNLRLPRDAVAFVGAAGLSLALLAGNDLVRDDGSGVLSSTGRGGDRSLFALRSSDVRFYLETHDLVTGRVALEPPTRQKRPHALN